MLKVRSLPRSPTACFSARTMDVTDTLSPGRAESTRSSSSLTSRYLGSCPGGRSSGLSCIRASCVFLNCDFETLSAAEDCADDCWSYLRRSYDDAVNESDFLNVFRSDLS